MHTSPKYECLVVVGLGNVGGALVRLLASMGMIVRVILIDFDRYESGNLGFQSIDPADVGRRKAIVQAGILRRMRPDMSVTAYACRFEDVPLGVLRGAIVLCAVDGRATRQAIGRVAAKLQVPFVDAALAREGSVRARAYLPQHACLECAWGPRDYELLEQRLPCAAGNAAPAATAAPPELGAIAAGLALSLCRRLVTDVSAAASLADRQWFLDVPSGRGWTATYSPNPECRLDHAPWNVVSLGSGAVDMPLRDVLALSGTPCAESDTSISALGQVFVRRLRCPKCGSVRRVDWRLSGRLAQRRCAACGVSMLIAAVDSEPSLGARNASGAVLGAPLARRGFVAGDIVTVEAAGTPHYFQLA